MCFKVQNSLSCGGTGSYNTQVGIKEVGMFIVSRLIGLISYAEILQIDSLRPSPKAEEQRNLDPKIFH